MLSLLTPRQSDAVGGPIGSMREAKTVASYPNYDAAYLAKRLGAKNPKALERNRYLSSGQFNTAQKELVYLQNATKGYEAEAEECLKKEFKDWLAGTHEDNYMPKVYDNTKGGAIRRDMSGHQLDNWKPTWWGPHQLTYLPGVREYLREQATLADKNSLDMNKLAHLGPQNVEEAWAYFKHWVKGRPVGPEECLRDSAKSIGDIERPFRAGPIHMQHDTRYSADNPYTGNSFVRTPMATTAQMAAAVTAAAPTVPLVAAAAAVPAAAVAAAAAMPYGPPAPNFFQRLLIAFQRNSVPVTAPVPVDALVPVDAPVPFNIDDFEDVNAPDEAAAEAAAAALAEYAAEAEADEAAAAALPVVYVSPTFTRTPGIPGYDYPSHVLPGTSPLYTPRPRHAPTALLVESGMYDPNLTGEWRDHETVISRLGAQRSAATPSTAAPPTAATRPEAYDDVRDADDEESLSDPDYFADGTARQGYTPFQAPFTADGTAVRGYSPLNQAPFTADGTAVRGYSPLYNSPLYNPYTNVIPPGGTLWEYAPESGSTVVDSGGPGATRAQRGSAGQGSSNDPPTPARSIVWPKRASLGQGPSPATISAPR